MKHTTSLLACLALAGCMTAPKFEMRAGATDADFNQDAGQCLAQANSISMAQPGQSRYVYVACMQGKGWRKVN